MAARHKFVEKGVPKITQVYKDFNITGEYKYVKPLRGITEIEKLLDLCDRHNSFISGGYARYCLSNIHNPSHPGDIDIFSSDQENHKNIIADFRKEFSTSRKFKSDVLKREESESEMDHGYLTEEYYEPEETESEFCVSFQPSVFDHPELAMVSKIQFVKPSEKRHRSGNLVDILNDFDFTVCKAALLSPHVGIYHHGLPEDEMGKVLRMTGPVRDPIMAFTRIIKYVKKGYRPSPLTLIKVLEAWKHSPQELQLENMLQMAHFQLDHMDDSGDFGTACNNYEFGEISGEIVRLKNEIKATTPEDNDLERLMDSCEAKKLDVASAKMYGKDSRENKNPQHILLDREGQLLRQSLDPLDDYPF